MNIQELVRKYPSFPKDDDIRSDGGYKGYLDLEVWKKAPTWVTLIAVILFAVAMFMIMPLGTATMLVLFVVCVYLIIALHIVLIKYAVGGWSIAAANFFVFGGIAIIAALIISWVVSFFVSDTTMVFFVMLVIYTVWTVFGVVGQNITADETFGIIFGLPTLLFRYVLPLSIIATPIAYPVYYLICRNKQMAAEKYDSGFTRGAEAIATALSESAIIGEMTEYFAVVGAKQLKKITLPNGTEFPGATSSFTLTVKRDGVYMGSSKFTFASADVDDLGSTIEEAGYAIALGESIVKELDGIVEEIAKGAKHEFSYDYEYKGEEVELLFVLAVVNPDIKTKRSVYDTESGFVAKG